MIGKVIVHALTTDTGINTLINGRVFPNRYPQDLPLPCIIYQTQSVDSTKCQNGDAHLKETLVLAVIGNTDDEVFDLAELVQKKLHFYEGTVDNTTIDFCTYEDSQDDYMDEAKAPFRELTFSVLSTITK